MLRPPSRLTRRAPRSYDSDSARKFTWPHLGSATSLKCSNRLWEPRPLAMRLRPSPRQARGTHSPLEEILRECVEAGWLDPERGTWIAPSRLPVPRAVHDLLTARVRELSRADQDALQWIAVLGERIDLTLLRLASECDDAVLRDAIERLCSMGLLADAGPGTPGVRFRHALGREAVLAVVSGVTRVLRHERVLAVLETRPAQVQGEQLEQLLTHALAAGDDVRASRYSLRAAQRARGLGARRETADHVAQALRLWTPAAGEEGRVEALLEHGRVLSAIGDNSAAIDVLDDARDAAIEVGRRDVAALALALCADARWDVNRPRGVLADLLQSRLEAANADATTAMRGEITALLARACLLSGEPVRAAGVAREGLILVTRRADSVRLGLRITLGAALIGAGEDGDGRDELLAVIRETARGVILCPVFARYSSWQLHRWKNPPKTRTSSETRVRLSIVVCSGHSPCHKPLGRPKLWSWATPTVVVSRPISQSHRPCVICVDHRCPRLMAYAGSSSCSKPARSMWLREWSY